MRVNDFLVKHKHIFIYYLYYLKANSQKVVEAKKKMIYIDIARPFYIDAQASAKVISKLMKSGYTPTACDIADFEKTFREVAEVQAIMEKL